MGGTIATNAGGATTFKYGVTRDWVRALTVVLPCGDRSVHERHRRSDDEGTAIPESGTRREDSARTLSP